MVVESDMPTQVAEQRPRIADRLERLIGQAKGAKRFAKNVILPLNVCERSRKDRIARTEEFEKKGLAT